jgi:hypothetical protein
MFGLPLKGNPSGAVIPLVILASRRAVLVQVFKNSNLDNVPIIKASIFVKVIAVLVIPVVVPIRFGVLGGFLVDLGRLALEKNLGFVVAVQSGKEVADVFSVGILLVVGVEEGRLIAPNGVLDAELNGIEFLFVHVRFSFLYRSTCATHYTRLASKVNRFSEKV